MESIKKFEFIKSHAPDSSVSRIVPVEKIRDVFGAKFLGIMLTLLNAAIIKARTPNFIPKYMGNTKKILINFAFLMKA